MGELKGKVEKQEMTSGAYDWVFMLVDDAMFIKPINFSKLIGAGTEATTRCSKPKQNKSLAFNLYCGPGSTFPVGCTGLTDYAFVLDRRAAQTFMSQYSILLYNSHDVGYHQIPKRRSLHHWDHSNVESFLHAIADENGVHVESMPAQL